MLLLFIQPYYCCCYSLLLLFMKHLVLQLMTNVLLRRAHATTSAWAQWIIVAALDVLYSRPPPTLDPDTLAQLQPQVIQALKKGSKFNTEGNTPNLTHQKSSQTDTTIVKDLHSLSPHLKSDVDQNRNIINFADAQDIDSDVCNKGNQNNESGDMKKGEVESDDKKAEEDSVRFCQQLEPAVYANKAPLTTSDFGMQVTPKLMGITSTKWVQVKKAQKVSKKVQTMLVSNNSSNESLTDSTMTQTDTTLSILLIDQETQTQTKPHKEQGSQTLLKIMKDVRIQTNAKEKPQKRQKETDYISNQMKETNKPENELEWILVPFSPSTRKRTANGDVKYERNEWTYQQQAGKQQESSVVWGSHCFTYDFHRSPEYTGMMQMTPTTNMNTDSFSAFGNYNPTPMPSSCLLFHGRPLVKSKAETKAPVIIPLDAVPLPQPDSQLCDPRLRKWQTGKLL